MPHLLIHIFGSPAAMCLPAALAIMHFQAEFPFDMVTVGIVVAPAVVMESFKLYRQYRKAQSG